MKFMMSSRQPLTILKEAEEIKVDYKDIERLADFVSSDWVCTAEVVIYLPKDQLINWDTINTYKEVLNIVIAVEDPRVIIESKNNGYKTFWAYPASSFWELRGLIALNIDQVLLDAPLFFDLPKVKSICGSKIELRAVVNKCYNSFLPRENGICGTYIRPEDIDVYSAYIDHFEFDTNNSIKKEYALYKIYAKDKEWKGNLNILLTNLNANVDNRGFELIPNDENDEKAFAHRRMTCGQKCQNISPCNYCSNTFQLINSIQDMAEKQNLQNETQ